MNTDEPSEKVISRIAPTPSGFLHLGNIANFIYTWALVRKNDGILYLRIDNVDNSRVRTEYIADIFSSLDWLGIDIDHGPSSPDDFLRNYSQQDKKNHYLSLIQSLKGTYACVCSRKDIDALTANGIYPQTCRQRNLRLRPAQSALRVLIPENVKIEIGQRKINLSREVGDFVIWRKDDMAAYQLASVADDEAMRSNLIVRGEDLLHSTAAQFYLADRLSFESFQKCRFIHHPLMVDGERKLSKSDKSLSLKQLRETGSTRQDIYEQIGRFLNAKAPPPKTLEDFLESELAGETATPAAKTPASAE